MQTANSSAAQIPLLPCPPHSGTTLTEKSWGQMAANNNSTSNNPKPELHTIYLLKHSELNYHTNSCDKIRGGRDKWLVFPLHGYETDQIFVMCERHSEIDWHFCHYTAVTETWYTIKIWKKKQNHGSVVSCGQFCNNYTQSQKSE